MNRVDSFYINLTLQAFMFKYQETTSCLLEIV